MSRPARKYCKKCDEKKLLTEFYKHGRYCKKCDREYKKEWLRKRRTREVEKIVEVKQEVIDLGAKQLGELEKLAMLPGASKLLASILISQTDDYLQTKRKPCGFNGQYPTYGQLAAVR